jgi:hypothetical protein
MKVVNPSILSYYVRNLEDNWSWINEYGI